MIGSACVSFKTNCSNYNISEIIEANRASVCSKLKSYNVGAINKCNYVSGTVCGTSAYPEILVCQNILNPIRQRDCDYLSNCKYYDYKCYTI